MIHSERAHLFVAAQSHPGMTGKNNEDSYGVSAYVLTPDNPTPVVFAIVSDGIGGHRSGEVAAQMTVEMISREVSQSDGVEPVAIFQKAFYYTSEAIWEKAQDTPALEGMGATCACALVIGDRLYVAWAGDSRIYLLRRQDIVRLSHDHTWIQEALDRGILRPEQAARHPNQHVIRRYIGSDEPPTPDVHVRLGSDEAGTRSAANQGLVLRPGDVIMLCTDGLTDLVRDEEIRAAVNGADLDETAAGLIALANSRGGHDNITVVLLGVPDREKRPRSKS